MKFFRSNKPKNSDLNPTPLALPPDTPIHAQHASSQRSQPQAQSRRSLDASSNADQSGWAPVDPRQDDPNTAARTRKDSKPIPPPSLPPGASPLKPVVANTPVLSQQSSQQPPSPVQSKSQVLRSPSLSSRPRLTKEPLKRRSGHIFPWPDGRLPEHHAKVTTSDTNPSDQRPPSIHSFETRDNREVSREREGHTHKAGTGGRIADFLFASGKDVPRQAKHQRDGQYSIEEVIRNLVQASSEDWSTVLDICEQVSHSEAAAKDASRGLRRAFKYGQAAPQLTAARLWAVILRNASPTDPNSQTMFLRETSGRKFMEAVEDVVTNPKTEPVVRERLLEVLGSAVSEYTGGDRKHAYAVLWRKLKAKGQSDQGIPLDPEDPMYKPPVSHTRQRAEWISTPSSDVPLPPVRSDGRSQTRESQSTPPPQPQTPGAVTQPDQPQQEQKRLKKKTRDRDREGDRDRDRDTDRDRDRDKTPAVPSIDQQIRRIISECEAAHGKARILSENVALANAADVEADTGGIIQEFYTECVQAQQRVMEQISWATAEAEKSREREARRQAAAESALSLPAIPNGMIASQTNAFRQKRGTNITKEEEMLGVLLSANQALTDAIQLRDDWQRAAIAQREERFVEERSRVETRIDRSQMYMAADGSLYAPEHDPRVIGSSRTPSPSPRSLPGRIGGSSVSSFDEDATPTQNNKQSYAQQQSPAMFIKTNDNSPSPNPAQSFYSVEGQLYDPQQHLQTRIYEHPSAPRTPVSSVHPRHPHGPRALPLPSRTPSPDLAIQQMRAPAAAAAVGVGGDALHAKLLNPEVSGGTGLTSPPPGFGLQSQHQTVYPEQRRQQSYRSMPPDPVPKQQPPLLRNTHSRNDGDEYPSDAPAVPSSKALGKRRAVEKIPDPEAFDPDDLFKDPRRPQTPLSMYGTPHNGSSDTEDDDGYYGHHISKKPIVYAYDAAAEREAERRRLELEAQLTETLNNGKNAKRAVVATH